MNNSDNKLFLQNDSLENPFLELNETPSYKTEK